jgi:MoaA/NifB/PqqE/SkfB family radical SAM enzyme
MITEFLVNFKKNIMITNLRRFLLSIKIVSPWHKPIAFKNLVLSFLKAKFTKKPVLRGVDIVTNFCCNLTCSHCNIDTMIKDKSKELSLDDYRRIEKEATELGVFQYLFTGGEPLLRKDFEELVKIFKPHKRLIFVQTNATLINTIEKAKRLRKIGVDLVNVSLDSGIEEEHDNNRGLHVIVGTVVSHTNLHSEGLHSLFEYARKTKTSIILNLAAPSGKWFNNTDILLTKEDQLYIRELVNKNPFLRLDMDSTINEYGCPAFKEKLYISPYGDVMGCTFVQVSFGNVKEKSLKEIRDKALNEDFMNKYAKRCYAAEDKEFINKYMSQLGEEVPKTFAEVSKWKQNVPE